MRKVSLLAAAFFVIFISCDQKASGQQSNEQELLENIIKSARFFEIDRSAYFSNEYEVSRYTDTLRGYTSGESYSFYAGGRRNNYLTLEGLHSVYYDMGQNFEELEPPPVFKYDRFTIREAMRVILEGGVIDWDVSGGTIEEANDEILKAIAQTINFQRSLNWSYYEIESAHFLFEHSNPKLSGRYFVIYTRNAPEHLLYIGVKLIEAPRE